MENIDMANTKMKYNRATHMSTKRFWFLALNPVVWLIVIAKLVWHIFAGLIAPLIYGVKYAARFIVAFIIWDYKNKIKNEYVPFKRIMRRFNWMVNGVTQPEIMWVTISIILTITLSVILKLTVFMPITWSFATLVAIIIVYIIFGIPIIMLLYAISS